MAAGTDYESLYQEAIKRCENAVKLSLKTKLQMKENMKHEASDMSRKHEKQITVLKAQVKRLKKENNFLKSKKKC